MRLRLFDRLRRLAFRGPGDRRGTTPGAGLQARGGRHRRDHAPASPRPVPVHHEQLPVVSAGARAPTWRPGIPGAGMPPDAWRSSVPSAAGASRAAVPGGAGGAGAARAGGAARARIREAPASSPAGPGAQAHLAPPVIGDEAPARHRPAPWYRAVAGQVRSLAPGATSPAPRTGRPARAAGASAHGVPAFAAPRPQGQPPANDGLRHCGQLERVIWRQWDPTMVPPPQIVTAIDRLADLPSAIKEKLASGLDGIYVGPGGVPELDDMTDLRGVPLPSGHGSWDVCAGAYGERKLVIGSRPSPTPDVTCHEVGHALDDLDSPPGRWQSDSAEFRMLYDLCQSHLVSDFHRQGGGLGRKEFFADAFAAIASGQRPALVDMLSGQTSAALRVMLYFNRRYGI